MITAIIMCGMKLHPTLYRAYDYIHMPVKRTPWSQMRIKLKSHDIPFVHQFHISCPVVSPPCSVRNCETIGQLTSRLWPNVIRCDCGLRWVSMGYTYWNNHHITNDKNLLHNHRDSADNLWMYTLLLKLSGKSAGFAHSMLMQYSHTKISQRDQNSVTDTLLE